MRRVQSLKALYAMEPKHAPPMNPARRRLMRITLFLSAVCSSQSSGAKFLHFVKNLAMIRPMAKPRSVPVPVMWVVRMTFPLQDEQSPFWRPQPRAKRCAPRIPWPRKTIGLAMMSASIMRADEYGALPILSVALGMSRPHRVDPTMKSRTSSAGVGTSPGWSPNWRSPIAVEEPETWLTYVPNLANATALTIPAQIAKVKPLTCTPIFSLLLLMASSTASLSWSAARNWRLSSASPIDPKASSLIISDSERCNVLGIFA
mmetsp:Transcript_51251/g.117189  ORF Transcript_51251/g.117189 Transcript_51251/m.117189 type:complete len:260 (+) Transcript_51251:412-1191(+)